MSQKSLSIWLGVLTLLVGLYAGVQLVGQGNSVPKAGGSPTTYEKQWFFNNPLVIQGQGSSLRLGGDNVANQINLIWTATSSIASTTLGSIGSAATTTATSVSSTLAFSLSGSGILGLSTSTTIQAGDPCFAGLVPSTSTATFSSAYIVSCAVSTSTATNATATVTIVNVGPLPISLPTSTVRIEVHHLGQ